MENHDIDRLLERTFAGDPPGQAFRDRVQRDSTAAFVRARQRRARWRPVWLSAAAALMAGVSFLLGRGSVPRPVPQAAPALAEAGDTVAVPSELVVWLDAARLFKQLGMEDRMNRALDCAGRLLPREAIAAGAAAGPVFFAASGDGIDSQDRQVGSGPKPRAPQSVDSVSRVLAEFLGGYDHASATD
jgi:hypothetical protein